MTSLSDWSSNTTSFGYDEAGNLTSISYPNGITEQFLAAAELVDDDSAFLEFLDWLGSILSARNVSRTALVAGLEASLTPLEDVDSWAHRLVTVGIDRLSG